MFKSLNFEKILHESLHFLFGCFSLVLIVLGILLTSSFSEGRFRNTFSLFSLS